ncbi:MAG TPA: hypothetical protein VLE97_06155 [Gaiellaceae bacterium]|nr:hypothetical protein [Gaiellaceae bacterium]
MIFEVIWHDVHGAPVRCSYCERSAENVVVLPLTDRPGTEKPLLSRDGDDMWLGLCAYCVLDMAKALQRAREAKP